MMRSQICQLNISRLVRVQVRENCIHNIVRGCVGAGTIIGMHTCTRCYMYVCMLVYMRYEMV